MKKKILRVWFLFLLTFVILHSTITVIYNFPINPFTEKFNKITNAYMNPLFSQTWTLFAPDPVSTNTKVEVKFSHGNHQETGWVNFSDTVLDQSQKSFFTYYQFYSGALIQMENDVKNASISIIDKLKIDKNKELLNKINDEKFLEKYGSEYVDDLIKEENVEDFLKDNLVVNSLYGMIYDYYDKQFSKITDIQIRLISEIFPEYGQSKETKYQFFHLPRVKVNQLIGER